MGCRKIDFVFIKMFKRKMVKRWLWFACTGLNQDNLFFVMTRGNNYMLFVLRGCYVSWNSNAGTFRSSNDNSNIDDCVNHSADNELRRNPLLLLCTQLIAALQKCICVNALLWLWGAGSLSEGNMFHHSFPSCLRQCTRHSVTWCNVRATEEACSWWDSVCHSAMCIYATEPWLPHYLIKRITLLFSIAFYRTVEEKNPLCVCFSTINKRFSKNFKEQVNSQISWK